MKQFIFNIFMKNKNTKRFYEFLSYIKGKIKYGISLYVPIMLYKVTHDTPVFLIFTPEHANLGDHAIAYAEQKIFNELGIKYFEITGRKLYLLDAYNYLKTLDNTMVFVNGGGNLGNLWPDIEQMNRRLIALLQKSTICFLPNSICYDKDKMMTISESKEIYNSHKKLYLYAREELSYMEMSNTYNNVKLIPDMVLSLVEESDFTRDGCLVCLRNDVEKLISDDDTNKLLDHINNMFDNVEYVNTVLNYNVSIDNRKCELSNIFKKFQKAELVITDRLHGMIFCAITGTKCIVINGRSPKIKGCYKWIDKLGYISMLTDINDIENIYNNLSNYPNNYDISILSGYYNELKSDIYSLIRNGYWN